MRLQCANLLDHWTWTRSHSPPQQQCHTRADENKRRVAVCFTVGCHHGMYWYILYEGETKSWSCLAMDPYTWKRQNVSVDTLGCSSE